MIHFDVTRFGLPLDSTFAVKDLITGAAFTWGADNFIRLDSFTEPVHVLTIEFGKGH
jgi:starch synthase (maltosyl-transferring)